MIPTIINHNTISHGKRRAAVAIVRVGVKIAATEGVKKRVQTIVQVPAKMSVGKDAVVNVQVIAPMNVEDGLVLVVVPARVQTVVQFNVEAPVLAIAEELVLVPVKE